MKTHIRADEIPIEQVSQGMYRQILGYNSNLMLVKVYFDKGGIGESHTHPHQQISYIVKGKFEIEIDGRKEILTHGDCFIIPENVLHGAVCLEEGILIDTFSPHREDFLQGNCCDNSK